MFNYKLTIAKIALWQPKPYVAFTNDGEPMSWWFYNNCFPNGYDDGTECNVYEASLLGELWHHFWWLLLDGKLTWRIKHLYYTFRYRIFKR
jgi:hypothetical protein